MSPPGPVISSGPRPSRASSSASAGSSSASRSRAAKPGSALALGVFGSVVLSVRHLVGVPSRSAAPIPLRPTGFAGSDQPTVVVTPTSHRRSDRTRTACTATRSVVRSPRPSRRAMVRGPSAPRSSILSSLRSSACSRTSRRCRAPHPRGDRWAWLWRRQDERMSPIPVGHPRKLRPPGGAHSAAQRETLTAVRCSTRLLTERSLTLA